MKKITRLFGIVLATVVALASLTVSALLQGCNTKPNEKKNSGTNKSISNEKRPPIICDPPHLPPPTTPPATNPPEKK